MRGDSPGTGWATADFFGHRHQPGPMHVWRGQGGSVAADRDATGRLVDRVAETGEAGLRVWYPPRHLAFGRRDARAAGYERARAVAAELGYPPIERGVGGRAVAFTGDVLGVIRAEPADATDPGVTARYAAASDALADALAACGIATRRGEPPDAFCPGTHSRRLDRPGGPKVAGLAQRVRREVAVVAGVVVVRDAGSVAAVLEPVYDALDVPFDPGSVGSLAAASDDGIDPAAARDRIEAAFLGDRDPTVRAVRDT